MRLEEIAAEVARARQLFPNQEETVSLEGWLAILVEEVGEVARDLNERMLEEAALLEGAAPLPDTAAFKKRIQEELVQVAAMAARMHRAVEVQG